VLVALLTAAAGASGCGGSGHAKSTTGGGAASTGGQPGASAALSARNVVASDFPGFTLAVPDIVEGASDWVLRNMLPPAQATSETTALRQLGFVGGLNQHVTASDGSNHEGLLIVEQFGSPAGARAEAKRLYAEQVKPMPGTHLTTFATPGVPGARAYKVTSTQFGGYNILWADGRYYYLVGAGWPGSDQHPPSQAFIVSAARQIYQRDHGLPG
jgi:hypothetical protein